MRFLSRIDRNQNAQKTLLLVAGFHLIALTGLGFSLVPNGEHTVTLPRPALPTGGAWVGNNGDPVGKEDDGPFSQDLGDATITDGGNGACVVITERDGELSGPNGEVQNGGFEFDCIEVKICWSHKIVVDVVVYFWTPTGFGWTVQHRVECRTTCNGGGAVEVCPTCP